MQSLQSDGQSTRFHLEKVVERTGKTDARLEAVCPEVFEDLFRHFRSLSQERNNNGMGLCPLTSQNFYYYILINNCLLTAYDIKVIKIIDNVFLNFVNKQKAQ